MPSPPAFPLQSPRMKDNLSTDGDWNGTAGRAVNEDAGFSGSSLDTNLYSFAFFLWCIQYLSGLSFHTYRPSTCFPFYLSFASFEFPTIYFVCQGSHLDGIPCFPAPFAPLLLASRRSVRAFDCPLHLPVRTFLALGRNPQHDGSLSLSVLTWTYSDLPHHVLHDMYRVADSCSSAHDRLP